MKIQLLDGLPFISASLLFRGQQLDFEHMLLDTGSAGTVLASDKVATIDLIAEPDDIIRRIRGVGGAEYVFSKQVDALSVGKLHVSDFEIEIGAMDYGFAIDGILGMDFLSQVGAIIDLAKFEVIAVAE